MGKNRCGSCGSYGINGCSITGLNPGAYQMCKLVPSQWTDRDAGKGRWLGSRATGEPSGEAFHILSAGEQPKHEKIIRTKDGVKIIKKSSKPKSKPAKGKKK